MKVRLPYGGGEKEEDLPECGDIFIAEPPSPLEPVADLAGCIRNAIAAPIGTPPLGDLFRPEDKVAIIVNDATRPSPTRLFLDAIAAALKEAGVPDHNVTIVIATGAHRPSTAEEMTAMLGEAHLARFTVVNHDALDPAGLVYLGETESGLPLWINRRVVEATRRIVTGTIAPHHSAGYSGGRKAIVPGVAGERSIRHYHSFPIQPAVPTLGRLSGNPAHEEALRAARRVGVDFSIQAIANPQGRNYLGIVAGDLVDSYLAGVAICERACRVAVPFRADLTLCSPGGYPRDINLHQAQKALSVAEMVTKPGGVIVLAAECRNGTEGKFARWLLEAEKPEDVIARYRAEGWTESSGKAMMFARAVSRHTVFLVSDAFDPNYLERLFLRHAPSLREAVNRARALVGPPLKTVIIPRASSVIPVVDEPADG